MSDPEQTNEHDEKKSEIGNRDSSDH